MKQKKQSSKYIATIKKAAKIAVKIMNGTATPDQIKQYKELQKESEKLFNQ